MENLASPQRLPYWLTKRFKSGEAVHALKKGLRELGLHTVCEEALCPNLGECWSRKTATLMILGDVCTRHCGFCSVEAGRPAPVDPNEPAHVAEMVAKLGLSYVVITSVARDDLEDHGATQFTKVIQEIRRKNLISPREPCLPEVLRITVSMSRMPPNDQGTYPKDRREIGRKGGWGTETKIEILTTDFGMREELMAEVCRARPDVFNHNLETVERLTPQVRHRATYRNSLEFLRRIKEFDPSMTTKSGIMLGLGETREEVRCALHDLRAVGCQIVTIGQYLRPSRKNLPVVTYLSPEAFEKIGSEAKDLGFEQVACGPYVRSSYHAEEMARKG